MTIPSRDERLQFLLNPGTDFRKVVVLETSVPMRPPAGAGDAGRATLRSPGPGRYEIAAETPSAGYLVLTETNYPGWEARVDGAPAEILRANHLVQALWLSPGKHQVQFEFHSRWLGLGFLLGALAAAGPAGWAVLRRRRRPADAELASRKPA